MNGILNKLANTKKAMVYQRPSSLQLVQHQNLSPKSFPSKETCIGQDHQVPNSFCRESVDNHEFLSYLLVSILSVRHSKQIRSVEYDLQLGLRLFYYVVLDYSLKLSVS